VVVVTRGWYELHDAAATATLGTTTTIEAPRAQLSSPGVIPTSHIHSHYSADSGDRPEFQGSRRHRRPQASDLG
jgi:hypothetical protein